MDCNIRTEDQGLIFIVSAPAGTGKTTLVKMLTAEFPYLIPSVSYTTRNPRPEEISGKDYHFISVEEFEEKIKLNDFLEYVKLYDDYYGTSRGWVKEQIKNGKHVVLTIDTQGALMLKNYLPAIFIFISPPSLEELKKRLEQRNTETSIEMEKRLAVAKKEIELAHLYDYNLINDSLDKAYDILRSIIVAEEHRIRTHETF